MEKGLLIAILVVMFLTMLASIYTAIIVSKDTKNKDLVKKASITIGVIILIAAIAGLAVLVTNIDSNSNGGGQTTTVSTTSAVESAGFNEVTLDEYLKIVKGSEKSIVLIARPTCGYCEQFAPILKQAMEDMNLTINYIDTDKLGENDWDSFTNSVTYLKEEEWGTPTVLIVQNGDAIDVNSGYVELDKIKEFFTKNGFGE